MAAAHLGYYFAKYLNEIGVESHLILKESHLYEWEKLNPGRSPKDEPLITIISEKKYEPSPIRKLREIKEVRKYDLVLSIAAGGLWYLPDLRKPYAAYSTGADMTELAKGVGYKGRQVTQARKFFKNAKLVFYPPEKTGFEMIQELSLINTVPWRQVFDIVLWSQEKSGKKDKFLNIFNPSSQQWIEKFPGQRLKRNDIFFNGFKIFLDTGGKGKAYYVNRGQNLDDTKELIEKLGLSGFTEACDELDTPFERKQRMKKMDVVVDQFGEGMYGLITLEAMAMQIPVITDFAEQSSKTIFSEKEVPPPILNASTPEQISEHLHELLDLEKYDSISKKSRNWIDEYHEPKKLVQWYWDYITKHLE